MGFKSVLQMLWSMCRECVIVWWTALVSCVSWRTVWCASSSSPSSGTRSLMSRICSSRCRPSASSSVGSVKPPDSSASSRLWITERCRPRARRPNELKDWSWVSLSKHTSSAFQFTEDAGLSGVQTSSVFCSYMYNMLHYYHLFWSQRHISLSIKVMIACTFSDDVLQFVCL